MKLGEAHIFNMGGHGTYNYIFEKYQISSLSKHRDILIIFHQT